MQQQQTSGHAIGNAVLLDQTTNIGNAVLLDQTTSLMVTTPATSNMAVMSAGSQQGAATSNMAVMSAGSQQGAAEPTV